MTSEAKRVLNELKTKLRRAAIAHVGGFRPPENPTASWFGKGVGFEDEGLPTYKGKEMFPLLQINVEELPFVPDELAETKLLVVFFNQEDLPFDKPNGDGWLIREYKTLEGLVPLPQFDLSEILRPFPVRWELIEDDAPGWETAWSLIDLTPVNKDEEVNESFYKDFKRYPCTKIGGYPDEVQGGIEQDNFVFQIGTEPKVCWQWVDRGTAYFFKSKNGEWSWDCQFL